MPPLSSTVAIRDDDDASGDADAPRIEDHHQPEPDTIEMLFVPVERMFGILPDSSVFSPDHIDSVARAMYPIDIDAPTFGSEFTANPSSYNLPELEAHLALGLSDASSSSSSAPPRLTPVHDSLFAGRRRCMAAYVALRGNVQAELQRLQGLDETQRPVVSETLTRRFQRLLDIMYYVENMQAAKRHLIDVMNDGLAPGSVEPPTLFFCKRFRADTTDSVAPHQVVIRIMLASLEMYGYRRYQEDVYEPIRTPDGLYTHAWRRVQSIGEFVMQECSSERDPEARYHATRTTGALKYVIEYLSKCEEPAFRQLRKNRRLIAFRNAVYVTALDRSSASEAWRSYFVPHACALNDPVIRGITSDNSVAAVYHDLDFPVPPGGWSARWSAAEGVLPPTPALDTIIEHQQWDADVNVTLKKFLGRMLHPTGGAKKLDSMQVYVDLTGTGNTGKSTLISDVVARFFDITDVAYMSNAPQKAFAFECCIDKMILCAPEVKSDFSECMDQALFQQAVSGENLSTNRKFKTPHHFTPFDLPIIMAGNEGINFRDNAESWSRRRIQFFFGVPVDRVDPYLSSRLHDELAHIIVCCNELYLQLASVCKGRVWDYIPDSFMRMREATAEQSHALTHYLAHASVEFGPAEAGYFMPWEAFCRSFKAHCAENELTYQTLKTDYCHNAFYKRRLSRETAVRPDPAALSQALKMCVDEGKDVADPAVLASAWASVPSRRGSWILGVRLAVGS